MAGITINPTRMEMKKTQARLLTARKGHKLLKDKRDELMKKFLDVVREDKQLRINVEKKLKEYYDGFSISAAISSPKMLQEALIVPKKQITLDINYKNMMSVIVPEFDMLVNGNNDINYGLAFTSSELDASILALSEIAGDMMRMAELEKTAQLLSEEIERTRRRVNALEYIMIPQYQETIHTIKMKLDENERGNTTRLMKVKDMMMQEQYAKNQSEMEDE